MIPSFEAWLKSYGEAWETGDADRAVELFTDDATYRETPFEEPMKGRKAIHAYWSEVPATQKDISFTFDIVTGSGNLCVARWRATFIRRATGAGVILDGVFVLRFDGEMKCSSLEEWWQRIEK